MKETVMIFCAHPDDEVIGVGGTIAKYAKENKKIVVVIFSYGEGSHPWLKKSVTVRLRVAEAKRAGKILGCSETFFLGLRDAGVKKHGRELKVEKKVKVLIEKYNPVKIFTHCKDDPWPDHQSVNKLMSKIIEDIKFEGDVYTFDVWNPLRIRERNAPKMIIDTTKTFKLKLKALKCFKSQKLALFYLYSFIYLRALTSGIGSYRFAEVFYKVK